MFDLFDDAVESIGDFLGSSGETGQTAPANLFGTPETSDAATATGGSSARAEQPDSFLGAAGQFIGDIGRGIAQEGLGGILDSEGMMARQQAQRDLSNRFQVVDENFVGPRNHNQVTQEEYERIARTYADIGLGRGDLTINTDEMTDAGQEQRYRDGTMAAIADMMMTTSGREQIYGMSNNVVRNDDGSARTDAAGNEIHHHTDHPCPLQRRQQRRQSYQ